MLFEKVNGLRHVFLSLFLRNRLASKQVCLLYNTQKRLAFFRLSPSITCFIIWYESFPRLGKNLITTGAVFWLKNVSESFLMSCCYQSTFPHSISATIFPQSLSAATAAGETCTIVQCRWRRYSTHERFFVCSFETCEATTYSNDLIYFRPQNFLLMHTAQNTK